MIGEKKQVTYDAISSFIIAIKCFNLEEINHYLSEYESIIVNRLESQTRQPSLYFAATLSDHQQSYEIMKLLIDHGANPSFKDNYQQTVLFYVCKDGKEKCLDLLLAEGLSLDDEDLYGQIPLFYVAKENRMNIIHKLIEKKVNLNHIDKIAGQTALFYAAKEGHLDMCKVLVESGCDLTIQDTSGKIASHLARRQNRQEVFQFLNSEYQILKEQKKLNAECDSAHNVEKAKSKRKKDPQTVHSTVTYRLYRADHLGNVNEVTMEEFDEFLSFHPDIKNMIQNPDEIDMTQLEQIKAKDAWLKTALRVLTVCCKAKGGYYFQEPVQPAKYGIDDYFDIITEPMDFGTIRKKLTHNVYTDINEFIRDMNLVFNNCIKYNGMENLISKYALEIKNTFEENMKQMGYMS